MRFDGYSNYGQAHNTGATTPAVEAAEPTSDRITAQHNDRHHNPAAGCAVCVREATTPAVTHPAPATDAAGNDVWNVWTGDDLHPTATTYSYAECIRVADALAAAGHKVFTDAI